MLLRRQDDDYDSGEEMTEADRLRAEVARLEVECQLAQEGQRLAEGKLSAAPARDSATTREEGGEVKEEPDVMLEHALEEEATRRRWAAHTTKPTHRPPRWCGLLLLGESAGLSGRAVWQSSRQRS